MIARVAESIASGWVVTWSARKHGPRLLQVTGSSALDAELPPRRLWHPVIIVSRPGGRLHQAVRSGTRLSGDADRVQRYLASDEKNPASLRRSVRSRPRKCPLGAGGRQPRGVAGPERAARLPRVRRGRRHVRARSRHALRPRAARDAARARPEVQSTMPHDAPLDFLWLGVLLERASQTARLLDVEHHALVDVGSPHPVLETALWVSLLRACSGFKEAFMKRSRGRVTGKPPWPHSWCWSHAFLGRSALRSARPSRRSAPSARTTCLGRSRSLALPHSDLHARARGLRRAPRRAGARASHPRRERGTRRVCQRSANELLGQGAPSQSQLSSQ